MARHQIHRFVNLASNGSKIHHDLQSTRIRRDLKDGQSVMDLLTGTLVNPLEENSLMSLSSGISPSEKIQEDLHQAYSFGKNAMENFINDCLVKLSKSIYEPIKKLKLGTFTTMTKKVNVNIKGREVQFSAQSAIFGKIALISQSRTVELKEIFKYPLGTVPYALADEMGIMIKTNKSDLLAALEKGTVLVDQMPKSSASIIDGMALVRKIKTTGLTFSQLADKVFDVAMSSCRESRRIDIVFDVYFEESIKNVERNRRCSSTISFKKIVPNNVIRQWHSFLGDGNNKTELVKFLVSEWKKKSIPGMKILYVTTGAECWCINDDTCIEELNCTQEEADTRMLLHASHISSDFNDVVIHTPDTDVVVIGVAFAKSLSCDLLVKTGVKDKTRIISINRLINTMESKYDLVDINAATDAMIGFHAFTGCDSISAFWRKGKVRPLDLMLKNPDFIASFVEVGSSWDVSENLYKQMESFVCAMYGGASNDVNELR